MALDRKRFPRERVEPLRCETVPPRARLSRIVRNRRTLAGATESVIIRSFISLRIVWARSLFLSLASTQPPSLPQPPRGKLGPRPDIRRPSWGSSPPQQWIDRKKNPSRVERDIFFFFFAKIYPIFFRLSNLYIPPLKKIRLDSPRTDRLFGFFFSILKFEERKKERRERLKFRSTR